MHPTVLELDRARSIVAHCHALIAANVKRCGSDGIDLPDPYGDIDPWRLIMINQKRNGEPTLVLKLKPSRGPYCFGEAAITKAETCLGLEWVELVRANDPQCVEMMTEFIAAEPQLWNEDIGE